MFELSQIQCKRVIDTLVERTQAYAIVLFGSAAQDRLREESDLDFAFLSDSDITGFESFLIAQELADFLGRDVDLIHFRQASTVLQAQIVDSGIILFDADPVKREYAYMRALKAYALLNEEREMILISKGYPEGSAALDWRHRNQQIGIDSTLPAEDS